jgi:hypothetical protein
MIRRMLALIVVMLVLLSVSAAATATLPPGGSFVDDDGNVHEPAIEAIAAEGITKGCNPAEGNTKFCPKDPVTRGQMAAFLVRALGLPPTTEAPFTDAAGVFEDSINRLAAAGVTKGCNPAEGNTRFCPHDYVTRGQMAAFLVRALGLPPTTEAPFTDAAGVFEDSINRLAAAGVTKGCNPAEGNTKYCPHDFVKRDQMATFLTRALGLTPITPPERGTIPLDGTGNDVLSLDFGSTDAYIAVIDITHAGSSNFVVWLRSLQTSDDLLVNEIGAYSGKVAFQIDPTVDDYLLEIDADGTWSGVITVVEADDDFDPVPSSHSGVGDDVVFFEQSTSAFVEFVATHSGSSNFIIWTYDIASDDRDLIVNEIGVFSGTQVEALGPGHYVIDITADGAWTLDLGRP